MYVRVHSKAEGFDGLGIWLKDQIPDYYDELQLPLENSENFSISFFNKLL